MQNPKVVETRLKGAIYEVPVYKVTNEGLVNVENELIYFCKGNKEDDDVYRQDGFFTETLLQTCKQYLEDVNVGELSSRETGIAITKIDEALMWLGKRAEDRKLRDVQGTYKS